MKKGKRGFTLIEVAIFLAITGLLFAGIAVGVQNSIYQQRTNDTVQNFIEFLRTAYAEVTDVQSTTGGRSEKVIYGKLITFGESHNLSGEGTNQNEIFKYTVIGNIGDSGGEGTLESMKKLRANIIREAPTGDGGSTIEFAGIAESYTPKWSAQIEPACKTADLASCEFVPIHGMILILRHPNSGAVNTFWSDELIEVNDLVQTAKIANTGIDIFNAGGTDFLSTFSPQEPINFCINTTGETNVYNRPNVKINQGARNASAIELLYADTEGYRCGS